jgi:hypothetical protein
VLLVLPSPLLENNSSCNCKAENTSLYKLAGQFTFVMSTMQDGERVRSKM